MWWLGWAIRFVFCRTVRSFIAAELRKFRSSDLIIRQRGPGEPPRDERP
jgi:hypothetical protein